jgi:hypothetical protein
VSRLRHLPFHKVAVVCAVAFALSFAVLASARDGGANIGGLAGPQRSDLLKAAYNGGPPPVVKAEKGMTAPVENAAAGASPATPKVACWDMVGDKRVGAARKPRDCGLVPRDSTYGNYLTGFRWTKWKATWGRGRGASYRLWPDIIVRLGTPRRVCGGRFFTRAHVHFVGGGRRYWPDRSYPLRSC